MSDLPFHNIPGLQSISMSYVRSVPTPSATVGAFHEIAAGWLARASLQALYDIYKAHKLFPDAGLLVPMSYLIDLRDMGHADCLWRALLEVDKIMQDALHLKPICLVRLTSIRSEAIEACKRVP